MNLPQEFYTAMQQTLQQDFDEYKASLSGEAFRGLRVNLLKCEPNKLQKLMDFDMNSSPFCDEGFYISNTIEGLGNHPLHHAGAFYLQEPSAMSAVSALDVKAGDRVLDLCAAPGGKSTQIASALAGKGLLWSNEIVGSRARILAQNIERCGIRNAVVSSCKPPQLCEKLEGLFDKVLVDAPCSGEGMIRREPAAVREWSLQNRAACADRQLKILDSAAVALREGGIMVYSTCTLSGEENEMVIDAFLSVHPEFSLVFIDKPFGRDAYSHFGTEHDISLARRILPQDGGEGHFVAKLKKTGDVQPQSANYQYQKAKIPLFDEFVKLHCNEIFGISQQIGDKVMLMPEGMPDFGKIPVLVAGVQAGQIVKNRFVPAHALYAASDKSMWKQTLDLPLDDPRVFAFLHGEEIECDAKGYTAVAVEGITLGFGKASEGRLKNHYPKGLRTL